MKITVKQLRRLIQEAPLADVLPPTQYHYPDDMRDDSEPDLAAKRKKTVTKFFKNKKFRDDAVKLYKNFNVPIYIIPAWTRGPTLEERVFIYDSDEAYEFLIDDCRISSMKAHELTSAMNSGAIVIVATAGSLERERLPTPWMIVHAIYDNLGDYGGTIANDTMLDLSDALINWSNDIELNRRVFTFASARNGMIGTDDDLAAEICTQEVLTTKGFTYNETGDQEIDEVLEDVSETVKGERERFEQGFSGKLLLVAVEP